METSNYLDLMFSWLSSVNAIPPEEIWKYNRIFLSLDTEHIHAICLEPPRVICPSSIVELLTAITLTKHAACVPPSASNDKFSSPHEKNPYAMFQLERSAFVSEWFSIYDSLHLGHLHTYIVCGALFDFDQPFCSASRARSFAVANTRLGDQTINIAKPIT